MFADISSNTEGLVGGQFDPLIGHGIHISVTIENNWSLFYTTRSRGFPFDFIAEIPVFFIELYFQNYLQSPSGKGLIS